jgi:hypothetical protein
MASKKTATPKAAKNQAPARKAKAASPTTSTKKKAPPKRTRTKNNTSAPLVIRAGRIPTHDEIAERAYLLWERSGHQHGRDEHFWLEAEQQIINGLPC